MYRDPFIRDHRAEGPLIPGTTKRFRWPEEYDWEVAKLRSQGVQDAYGMYLLRPPYDSPKETILVEAYYPNEIRPSYWKMLDPYRKVDMKAGKLVVVACFDGRLGSCIKEPEVALHGGHIEEINRNARNARRELRRTSTAQQRKTAIDNDIDDHDRQVYNRWNQFVDHAVNETVKHGLTTRVGPSTLT